MAGEVAEWTKAPDWRSGIRSYRIVGSNPTLSVFFSSVACGKTAEYSNQVSFLHHPSIGSPRPDGLRHRFDAGARQRLAQQSLIPAQESTLHLIELSGISRTFQGEDAAEVSALREISLQIDAGEFVCITGPSGAGKSTLMHILGCLDRPTSGSYRLAGREISKLGQDGRAWLRRRMFGFVFQGYNLIESGSASENVELPGLYAGLPRKARSERAGALLEKLGLADRAAHLPAELSGGEQQRVAIARALMNGGRIILADEPTGALERAAGDEVLRELEGLAAQGHTVVIVSHNPEIAAHAGRRIELRDGRVVHDSGASKASDPAVSEELSATPAGRPALLRSWEMARVAWRFLGSSLIRGARLRTAMSAFGVALAVWLGSMTLGIAEGAYSQFAAVFNAMMGPDVIRVFPEFNRRPRQTLKFEGLTLGDARAIEEQITNVRATSPYTFELGKNVRRGEISEELSISAHVDLGRKEGRSPSADRIDLGGFITQEDDERLAQVAVLGSVARAKLFPPGANPIGEQVLIENVPFRVKGVLKRREDPTGLSDWTVSEEAGTYEDYENSWIDVPYKTATALLFESDKPREIYVYVQDPDRIFETARAIRDLGIRRHGEDAFVVEFAADYIATAKRVRTQLTMALGLIAGIPLLAGVLSIMFVMLMAVRSRKREIGIRMALGARKKDILKHFLSEAIVLVVAGGLLGVVVVLASIPAARTIGIPMAWSPWHFLIPFAGSLLAGLIFGTIPARRAARLDPVSALAAD